MPPRIFIGGTGRSGTTILYKALGCHEAIHSLEREMSFIIDPDGLINLVDALTDRFSPVQAREAFYRFERLMKIDLAQPHQTPYIGYDLPNVIGRAFYWQRLEQFCDNLVLLEYDVSKKQQPRAYKGGHLPIGIRHLRRLWHNTVLTLTEPHRVTFNWPRKQTKLIRYFANRDELINLTSDFVDDLFLHPTLENDKETWCEKTPQNIFHLNFLNELFPDSVFIHVKRDPRGVVQSVVKQAWGPNNIEEACLFLSEMYKYWFGIKAGMNFEEYRYTEVSLEDLASDPEGILGNIAQFIGLDNCYGPLPEIEINKVNYWKDSLSIKDLNIINNILGNCITKLGYDL